jgi:D-alanyl-lipoteichoic acid acyltransferase DltB (MBOAT superfamily)
MLFNSLAFLALLLPTLFVYWVTRSVGLRLGVLFVSSIVFYGFMHWPSVLVLLGTIGANFGVGLAQERRPSKWLLGVGIAANLVPLTYFKYAGFLAAELTTAASALGFELSVPTPSRWVPLGISFFTFQVIAYQVDVYRRELPAERNLLVFAVFKSFFAQLIAGPIVRGRDILPELRRVQPWRPEVFHRGLFLVVAGLALKVGFADVLAQFAVDAFDRPVESVGSLSTSEAWLGLYAYAFQLFADFWGYSTVAVGLGLLFGFTLPVNFRLPYLAFSLQDFWRRWHITLSAWFRDYLYVPLGGSRSHGTRNLLLTMGAAGIWHGAGWNFLLWGALHGAWLAVERALGLTQAPRSRVMLAVRVFATFHGVCLAWVLFRAKSLPVAFGYWQRLLLPPFEFNPRVPEILAAWLGGLTLFMVPLARHISDERWSERPLVRQVALTVLLVLFMMAYGGATFDFIYFAF